MLKLDVPFIPEGDYPDFLAERSDCLASVHFSVNDADLSDARQRLTRHGLKALTARLATLGCVPKYALMNSRLHTPQACFDDARLDRSARLLEHLIETTALNGVIFADPYYLQALSDARPDVAEQLEAVPSVNCMLDSADKTFAMLALIEDTAFQQPGRIVPDRSLNRNPDRLEAMTKQLRTAYPNLCIHLIANEGCLYQCPYKPAHDAHIAMVNEGLCGERTFALNRDFGCVRRMFDNPGLMLASPFIRPEDTDRYKPYADGIKLCGRTKGTDFLKQAITAWKCGSYDGNLLDLMDAMGDLAHKFDIPNRKLPTDFFDRVTNCDKQCTACGWCAKQFERICTRAPLGLT